jgi:ribosome biogenesis GTPase / thiamine phosphate phosphatase
MAEAGLVIARHRRHVIVEDERGGQHLCLTLGRSLDLLAGDQVDWERRSDGTAVVKAVASRRSTLTRIDSRGRQERVAANVTQLVIVAAPAPKPDCLLIDRYLVAAELMGAAATLVLNKADLVAEPFAPLEVYRRIGYAVCLTSAKRGTGLPALERRMRTHCNVMVGQSGVGKSSLLNALLGEALQAVGELSDKGGQGKHTTTTAVLVRLPGGGELIDSPGVRGYAPFIADARDIEHGFREFAPFLGRCRFDDCAHRAEPDCALKAAVAAGAVDAHRYESYLKLRGLLESLPAT